MGFHDCRRCGKQAEEGEIYCHPCQAQWKGPKPWGLWVFSLVFSGALLLLAKLLLGHGEISWSGFLTKDWERKRVALVNGEPILRAEFEDRFRRVQSMLERQHGGRVFSGEAGERALEELKGEVLEVLVAEKLIGQEARRLGIGVSDERLQREMERIAREVFGAAEGFLQKPEWGGIHREELQNQLRNLLLIEAIKSARAPIELDVEKRPESWFSQVRHNARVEIFESFGQAGLGGLWGNRCCGQTVGRGVNKTPASGKGNSNFQKGEAEQTALGAFQKDNINAEVID